MLASAPPVDLAEAILSLMERTKEPFVYGKTRIPLSVPT